MKRYEYRKNRTIGVEVGIEPSENIDGGYMTVCEHGMLTDHYTYSDARAAMAYPWTWCDDGCRQAYDARQAVTA